MKWDYQVREYRAEVLTELKQALAAAGGDGWELVTVIPHPMPAGIPPKSLAIFKRPAAGGAVLQASAVTVNVQVSPEDK